jgi:hypothetical protein
LQHQLVLKTLTRIAIPSLSASLLCFFTFSASTHAIFDYVQTSFDGLETGAGYEALNLILTDNSNQFIQNAHNFLSLNFCFLTSSTFSFLYNNQVKLYHALFEELSLLFSLVEQVALCSEGRKQVYKLLLLAIQRYINEDLKVITTISSSNSSNKTNREDLPLILLCQMPQNDPLQSVLYLTSVGQPSYIYSTIKSLRKARSIRLASLQRKMPEVNMYLLYILGFTTWVTFPLVTAGSYTVGGEELIDLFRNQLSLGVFGMGLVLGIINELKQPEVGSAYNVDYSILGTMLDGLEKEVNGRLMTCDLDDVRNDGPDDDDNDNNAMMYKDGVLADNKVFTSDADDSSITINGVKERNSSRIIENIAMSDRITSSSDNIIRNSEETTPWFGKRVLNRIRRNSQRNKHRKMERKIAQERKFEER